VTRAPGTPYRDRMSAPVALPNARRGASTAAIWTALSLVYVAWSTTFVGIRVANETIPPMLAGGLRFLVAGGLLLPIALSFGDRAGDRPKAAQWKGAAVVALFMMFGGNGGIVWAERTIPSGMAGLAIATVPLWMVAIDRVVLGHRQPRMVVIGLTVGFVGAALLVGGNALEGEIDMGGLIFALGAAASWAVGSIYQRHAALPERPLVAAGMEMVVAALLFFLVGGLIGEFGGFHPSTVSRASWLAVAYLVVVGSWIGFTCYLWLLRNARTSLVATYAYVTPIGAVIVGSLILDESLTASTLFAGALIVVAVALIVTGGGSARADPERPAEQLDEAAA
jgi:drug/metabolite transporter (DMT)-like permease